MFDGDRYSGLLLILLVEEHSLDPSRFDGQCQRSKKKVVCTLVYRFVTFNVVL